MPTIIVDDFTTVGDTVRDVGYDQLPLGTVLMLAADGDADAAAWLKGQITAGGSVVFDFDPGKHPRDEHGRFIGTGGDGGSTFVTRYGPDVATSEASRQRTADTVALAEQHSFARDRGTYKALANARTTWQGTFTDSADIQRAADALMGYDPQGQVKGAAAADARELLTAMAGNGPGEDTTRVLGVPIHIDTYGPNELMRGAADPGGEIVRAFKEAKDSGGTVGWSMASFVQGTAEAAANDPYPSRTGEPPPDLVAATAAAALGYVNAGEAPVLIRATGQALNLDGHFEALAGGKFAVDEIRPATEQERRAWGTGGPSGIPVETPITIVDLHQVENVRLPPGVATR